ncbi:MAG: ABC transporter substrate-binding protein [Pseudomonadota bacterium]
MTKKMYDGGNDPRELWNQAHDFDPKDPLVGLNRQDLGGPRLERRTVLRLLAACGALTAAHVMPGMGVTPARASTGGTLQAGWSGTGEFRTLDPAQIPQVLLFQITSNVLSGLTHINPALVAEGDLATDWEVSADGTEYIFNLREGVTFHNGDPFTADDVLYTYERSKDPQQSIHSRVLNNVASLEKMGDYKVKFTLSAPQASFLVKTLERSSGRAMTIVSKGAIESMGLSDYGLRPVGTGPFKVTDHQLGQSITLEKFENFYDPERPKVDKVVITPILDPEPFAAAMEAGDIHISGGNPIPPELIDRFEQNPDLVTSIVPGPGFQCVWMNPNRDPFKVSDFSKPVEELMEEPGFKVRLAIAKAIDRDLYIKQAHFGRAVPGYGSVNPAMGFYYDEGIADKSNQNFDLEEAQKLLAEAGYPGGEGFPKLKLAGTPSNRRDSIVVANILKRNLGIEVEVESKEPAVLLDEFRAMEFDMQRLGSGGDFDPDDALVDWMQTSSKFNGPKRDTAKNPMGYFSDPVVDELIDKQSATADPEARKAMVQEADLITSNKVAAAFVYHPIDPMVWRKEVTFPEESRIPGLVDLDRVTIES